MPDGGHAEILQVIPRQLAEDLAVDLIVTERRLVFAESKASQPVSHVHSLVPNTCDNDRPARTWCPGDCYPPRTRFLSPVEPTLNVGAGRFPRGRSTTSARIIRR